jgi:fucokinase
MAPAAAPFDYVVVTASTPRQRDQYRDLVQRRTDAGLYPPGLKFFFCNDPQTGRVGSGGGTLLALVELYREESGTAGAIDPARAAEFYDARRVLVLHAGGESRRLPCYVPEGKLFAPLSLPVEVCGAPCPPVVLDIVLQLYFKYPWAKGEVILASGDVIVNFDVREFSEAESAGSFLRGDICGFGKGTSFEQGSRHGVFAFDKASAQEGVPTLAVRDFHQKSPPEVLARECAAAADPTKCAVDTGIFALGPRWVSAFFEFAAAPLPGPEAMTVLDAVEASMLFFDFYLECVTASLLQQSVEAFVDRMAAGGSKMAPAQLELMHRYLSPLELRGAMVAGGAFLHFGTVTEFPDSSVAAVEQDMWPIYVPAGTAKVVGAPAVGGLHKTNCDPAGAGVQVMRTRLGSDAPPMGSMAWVESCSESAIWLGSGGFNMLVGVDGLLLEEGTPLPDGICLDGRHWKSSSGDQYCVAVYSSKDTFKKQATEAAVVFCGARMTEWLGARGLSAADVWDSGPGQDLWTARLFCPRGGASATEYTERLRGFWDAGRFDAAWFRAAPRVSLQELNDVDSALERDARRIRFRSSM